MGEGVDVVVSRRHAEVFQGPDGFYIHDLGSSNGIIVNQARIDNPYLLSHGDRITIGSLMIYFMNAGARLVADIEERPVVPQSAQSNKKCHNCGASNTSIARFCTTCGTSL